MKWIYFVLSSLQSSQRSRSQTRKRNTCVEFLRLFNCSFVCSFNFIQWSLHLFHNPYFVHENKLVEFPCLPPLKFFWNLVLNVNEFRSNYHHREMSGKVCESSEIWNCNNFSSIEYVHVRSVCSIVQPKLIGKSNIACKKPLRAAIERENLSQKKFTSFRVSQKHFFFVFLFLHFTHTSLSHLFRSFWNFH